MWRRGAWCGARAEPAKRGCLAPPKSETEKCLYYDHCGVRWISAIKGVSSALITERVTRTCCYAALLPACDLWRRVGRRQGAPAAVVAARGARRGPRPRLDAATGPCHPLTRQPRVSPNGRDRKMQFTGGGEGAPGLLPPSRTRATKCQSERQKQEQKSPPEKMAAA